MSRLPHPDIRRTVQALATMNVRAVLTKSDVRYMAPRGDPAQHRPPGTVGARFRPRDARGQFVRYEDFHIAASLDAFLTDMAQTYRERRAREPW